MMRNLLGDGANEQRWRLLDPNPETCSQDGYYLQTYSHLQDRDRQRPRTSITRPNSHLNRSPNLVLGTGTILGPFDAKSTSGSNSSDQHQPPLNPSMGPPSTSIRGMQNLMSSTGSGAQSNGRESFSSVAASPYLPREDDLNAGQDREAGATRSDHAHTRVGMAASGEADQSLDLQIVKNRFSDSGSNIEVLPNAVTNPRDTVLRPTGAALLVPPAPSPAPSNKHNGNKMMQLGGINVNGMQDQLQDGFLNQTSGERRDVGSVVSRMNDFGRNQYRIYAGLSKSSNSSSSSSEDFNRSTGPRGNQLNVVDRPAASASASTSSRGGHTHTSSCLGPAGALLASGSESQSATMLGPGSRASGAGRGTASGNAYHGAYIGRDSLAPAYTQPRRKVSRAGNVGEMQYPGNNHGSGGSYHHHAGDNHNQRQPPHHRGGFPSTRGGAKYPSSCSDDDAQAFASGDEGGRRLMGSPGARRHQSLAGTGAGEHQGLASGDARRRAALDSNKPFVPRVAPGKPKPWIPRRDRRVQCLLLTIAALLCVLAGFLLASAVRRMQEGGGSLGSGGRSQHEDVRRSSHRATGARTTSTRGESAPASPVVGGPPAAAAPRTPVAQPRSSPGAVVPPATGRGPGGPDAEKVTSRSGRPSPSPIEGGLPPPPFLLENGPGGGRAAAGIRHPFGRMAGTLRPRESPPTPTSLRGPAPRPARESRGAASEGQQSSGAGRGADRRTSTRARPSPPLSQPAAATDDRKPRLEPGDHGAGPPPKPPHLDRQASTSTSTSAGGTTATTAGDDARDLDLYENTSSSPVPTPTVTEDAGGVGVGLSDESPGTGAGVSGSASVWSPSPFPPSWPSTSPAPVAADNTPQTTAPALGPPSDEWGIWLEVEARTTGAGGAKRGWIEMIRSEVFGQEIRGEMEDWALAAEIARVRRETNAVLVRFHVFPDPGIDFERSSYTHAALLDGLEREAVQFRVHSAAAVSAPVSPVHWFSHSLDFDLFLGAFRRVSPKLFLERAQKLASLEARGQQAPAAGGKPGFMYCVFTRSDDQIQNQRIHPLATESKMLSSSRSPEHAADAVAGGNQTAAVLVGGVDKSNLILNHDVTQEHRRAADLGVRELLRMLSFAFTSYDRQKIRSKI